MRSESEIFFRFEILHGSFSCHCVICKRGVIFSPPGFSILVTVSEQAFFLGDDEKTRKPCPSCSALIPLPYVTSESKDVNSEKTALEAESRDRCDLGWLDLVPAFHPIHKHLSYVTANDYSGSIRPVFRLS